MDDNKDHSEAAMRVEADRVFNLPYFAWRRDSKVQLPLNVAAASVFTGFAGFDAVLAGALPGSSAIHLIMLAFAGVTGASIILQNRFVVLGLRWLIGGLMLLDTAGLFQGPMLRAFDGRAQPLPPLAMVGCSISILLGAGALAATMDARWAEFRSYCSRPEQLPGPSRAGKPGGANQGG